jgi:hypothetical protein
MGERDPKNSELREKIGGIDRGVGLKGDDTNIHTEKTRDTVTADCSLCTRFSAPTDKFRVDDGG